MCKYLAKLAASQDSPQASNQIDARWRTPAHLFLTTFGCLQTGSWTSGIYNPLLKPATARLGLRSSSHLRDRGWHKHICIYIYIYVYLHTNIHIHVYICIYTYIYMRICTHIICVHVYACIYIHIPCSLSFSLSLPLYTYIYIYVHTYTVTQRFCSY